VSLKVQITVTEHWCDKGGGEGLEAVNPLFENLYPKWTNHSTAGWPIYHVLFTSAN